MADRGDRPGSSAGATARGGRHATGPLAEAARARLTGWAVGAGLDPSTIARFGAAFLH